MSDVLRIARLKIALYRAFLGRAILIFMGISDVLRVLRIFPDDSRCSRDALRCSQMFYRRSHGDLKMLSRCFEMF